MSKLFKLTQIYRIKTASIYSFGILLFTIFLLFILTSFTLFNIEVMILPQNEDYIKNKITFLQNPFNYESNEKFAEYLCKNDLLSECQQQHQIAQVLRKNNLNNNEVLGISKTINEAYDYEIEKNQINAQIGQYWQNIIELKPVYRDAYIQYAQYQYRVGKINIAKDALNKALILDPLYSTRHEVKRFLNLINKGT